MRGCFPTSSAHATHLHFLVLGATFTSPPLPLDFVPRRTGVATRLSFTVTWWRDKPRPSYRSVPPYPTCIQLSFVRRILSLFDGWAELELTRRLFASGPWGPAFETVGLSERYAVWLAKHARRSPSPPQLDVASIEGDKRHSHIGDVNGPTRGMPSSAHTGCDA